MKDKHLFTLHVCLFFNIHKILHKNFYSEERVIGFPIRSAQACLDKDCLYCVSVCSVLADAKNLTSVFEVN